MEVWLMSRQGMSEQGALNQEGVVTTSKPRHPAPFSWKSLTGNSV